LGIKKRKQTDIRHRQLSEEISTVLGNSRAKRKKKATQAEIDNEVKVDQRIFFVFETQI